MKCSTTPILATELVTYYPEIDLQPLRDYLHRLHSSEYTHGSLKQTKNHYLHEVDTLKPMFDKSVRQVTYGFCPFIFNISK